MAKPQEAPTKAEALRAYNMATYGTNNPNVKDIATRKKLEEDAVIQEKLSKGGASIEKTGMSLTGQPESTMGMSDTDAFFSEGRAVDRAQLGGFKSFGDKSAFETQNALRKLRGEKELYSNPNQFYGDVNKSMAVGATSALNTPEGRQRATSAGVQSGLSFAEADQAVQNAFKNLQTVGKREGAIAKAAAPTAAPTAAVTVGSTSANAPTATANGTTDVTTIAATKPAPSLAEEFYGASKPLVNAAALTNLATGTALGAKAVEKVGDALNFTKSMDAAGAARNAEAWGAALSDAQRKEEALRKLAKGGRVSVKTAEAAMEATSTAAKAAAEASRLAKVAKIVEPFAGVASVASKTGKVLGKAAVPLAIASELVDVGRFAFSPEQREAMTNEVRNAADKGMLYSGAAGALSPMKTILGTGKIIGETLQQDTATKAAEAGLNTAQRKEEAILNARRQKYSDEEYKALSNAERSKYMTGLRKKFKVIE
jgi:hypothetical protein